MPKIDLAIADYLSARNRLLALAAKYPELLAGNDNVIGRIGEYLAMSFLSRKGRVAKRAKSKSEKGYDLLVGRKKVSVKLLSSENVKGRGMRLTDPWDELLVLEFDTRSLKFRIGHLLRRQFEQALVDNPGWSRNPIVKKTMLGEKGLIGRYGSIEGGNMSPKSVARRRNRGSTSVRKRYFNGWIH